MNISIWTQTSEVFQKPTYMTCVGQTFTQTSFTKLEDVSSQGHTYPTEKWHNGKSDENLLGVSPQTSPPPNKWIKRKPALLSPLPLSVWWTLVSDESLSWPYSAGSHVMLSHRSLPQGSHRKSLLPGHHTCQVSQLPYGEEKMQRGQGRTVNFRQGLSNVSVTMRVS